MYNCNIYHRECLPHRHRANKPNSPSDMQFGFSTARSPEMASVIGSRGQQLVVTPEVVVSNINNMKENKSPGVNGISPKILKETVEQISTPLAHVFNMSL